MNRGSFDLLVYDLDLLVDHLSGEPVNGHVHPVMLLTFDDEICQTSGIRWVPAGNSRYR